MPQHVQVAIIGGGISGTALAYVLSQFSDLKQVTLFEKHDHVAPLNSNAKANSQTLHCGDIETNYTLEKAIQVKKESDWIVGYAQRLNQLGTEQTFLFKHPKMILAIGDAEISELKKRHEQFSAAFPYMQWWDEARIRQIEPLVCLTDINDPQSKRNQPIAASGALDEYTTVDYGQLAQSFQQESTKAESPCTVDYQLNTQVQRIEKQGDGYLVVTNQGDWRADFVVVSAGAHSLWLAHRMGHGLHLSNLSMAGSFYHVPQQLNGKVYTMQNDKLPFAAVHGDPDLLAPEQTRLGPTALVMPKLERYQPGTYWQCWQALRLDGKVLKVLWGLLKDRTIRNYLLENVAYEIPWLHKHLFIKQARKVIPSLQAKDLVKAKGMGGVRPQVINKKTLELQLGEATLIPDDERLIFNMTPSPGATTCLGNAKRDAATVCAALNATFDDTRFEQQLTPS